MRWPWPRRRGRRRGGDAVVERKAVVWDASWGETFLPNPAVFQADDPAPERLTSAAQSTVRLGFTDGTHCELPSGTDSFERLVALAARLTRSDTRQGSDRAP